SLNKGTEGAVMWMGLNAYSKKMDFELPPCISTWERVLNTAIPSADDILTKPIQTKQKYFELESRSMGMLLAKEYASKIIL
ncbi:MAG: glycogen-debranching protein, partial [Prochlorococcaceae cyanobacterium ETNP1_MAG_8]|nr:glycogen-debranching protein [Prochlorococcaceae cyanobacterium ETNP1_MAG_8]